MQVKYTHHNSVEAKLDSDLMLFKHCARTNEAELHISIYSFLSRLSIFAAHGIIELAISAKAGVFFDRDLVERVTQSAMVAGYHVAETQLWNNGYGPDRVRMLTLVLR